MVKEEAVNPVWPTGVPAAPAAFAERLGAISEDDFRDFTFTTSGTTPSFLLAVSVGNAPQWPTGSLESELSRHGAVPDIIYDWIGKTSGDPESRAVKRIMAKMVNRTLLDVDKKRVLKLFTMTSRYYVLPERTSALVIQRSVRLLEECLGIRPDVHNQLTKDIAIGFARRTPEPSGE